MVVFNVGKCSKILGDKKSIVMKMHLTSNSLKNKHNYMAYHQAREVFAAGFAVAGHIYVMGNPSDILTKPVSSSEFYKHTDPVFLGII